MIGGHADVSNSGQRSARQLRECPLADNLSPQKARILLMVALTRTHESIDLQRFFDN